MSPIVPVCPSLYLTYKKQLRKLGIMRRILNTFLFIPAFLLFLEGMPHLSGFRSETGSDSSLSSNQSSRPYGEFFLAEAVEESEENEENETASEVLYLCGFSSLYIQSTVQRTATVEKSRILSFRHISPFNLRAPPSYT